MELPQQYNLPYQSPQDRELAESPQKTLVLTPFNMQRIVFNLIQLHWLNDDPAKDGYLFEQRYDQSDSDSSIFIDLAYNWKNNPISKRPCIIIKRSPATYVSPIMGQLLKANVQESEQEKLYIVNMDIEVFIVYQPIEVVEQIADFTMKSLLQFEQQIRNDYKLRRFRVQTISDPQPYKESQDDFIITIKIDVSFDSRSLIKEDDLKLKTVTRTIFLNLCEQPLTNQ